MMMLKWELFFNLREREVQVVVLGIALADPCTSFWKLPSLPA